MESGSVGRLRGKWWAARSLAQFVRYFDNWREVWGAYRISAPLPPLHFRRGLILEHGTGDDPISLFREIFVDECYCPRGFYIPKPGDVVVDVGANIGTFALFLQWKARGVRVHCFEPGSEARRRLERNIETNGLRDLIRVHGYAVSDRRKTVELQVGKLLAQHSLYRSEFSAASGVEKVDCLSLAEALELCGAPRIDLLKIDAEGAEIEIVEGADASVWPRIERVSFEYHDRIRSGCRARVEKALAARGFDDIRPGLVSPLDGFGVAHARRKGRDG